ncbi:sensor histidine kinase [Bryobacter aggregatus]|uniref:sensor histidine kinase n=1 Tax=Bryobacter aggregatus TaxID=360054 RepID=UPI001EE30120|nr:HAMP domain-containing sensor histidine kinase [Bryobacter aggregatus]
MPGRRRQAILFTVLGIVMVALAVALQSVWVVVNWRFSVLLVLGSIFFLLLIAGVTLNSIFLVREIRKNEQHNAFLNAVTHELKTPVASIKLYLETLERREVPPEKRKEFYRVMLDDSNRLMNTIEQVLEASRVGNRDARGKQSVSLTAVVADCVEMAGTRHHLPDGAIHLERRLPTGDSAIVIGDAQELKSAVSNLIENAIKYRSGEIKVAIEVERLDGKRVAIRVKDQGIGIAQEELKRIFGRFYRTSGTAAQKVKGAGLGLFIVRSVAKKHRGRAYAASDGIGKGSTFTMELESVFPAKVVL